MKCNKCNTEKEASCFYFKKNGNPYSNCKECRAKAANSWRASKQEWNAAKKAEWNSSNRKRVKATRLQRIYSITQEDYDQMLQHQGGVCYICKSLPSTRSLAVDHDHVTKKVRGLLCTSCNVVLGLVKDSPDLLRRAADYLEQHS